VRGAIAATDAVTEGLTPAALDSAVAHALTAARYEWMFWDAAHRGEVWPI
jgi:thiaminase/transcriptional activator TenA